MDTELSGVALLKIIVRESHIDTNATVSQIRRKLSSLDEYVLTVDSDIGKLNQYVKLLVATLKARKERTEDLLINLFKGYASVSDEKFREWIQRKQDDHDEGDPMSVDELMHAAKNKYDVMVEKGTWNKETTDQKLVVLASQLKDAEKRLTRKIAASTTTTKPTKTKTVNKTIGDGHPKTWPKPKNNEPKKKMYKGNMWYFCDKSTGGKCHGEWRRHIPTECRGTAGLKRAPNAGTNVKADEEKSSQQRKKLKVAQAKAATTNANNVIQDSDDDDEEE